MLLLLRVLAGRQPLKSESLPAFDLLQCFCRMFCCLCCCVAAVWYYCCCSYNLLLLVRLAAAFVVAAFLFLLALFCFFCCLSCFCCRFLGRRPLKKPGCGLLWPRPFWDHDLFGPRPTLGTARRILATTRQTLATTFQDLSAPPDPPPSPGPPSAGPPKISRFFFLLPPHFHSFFLPPGIFSCLSSSLWGSSRGILVVFWSVGTSNVLVFALWLSCETPAACRPPTHLRVLALTPPIPRNDSKREKKNENGGGRRKKKRKVLGLPPFEPSTLRDTNLRAPALGAPTFSGLLFVLFCH